MNRGGEILAGNVIFILLNLIFLVILIVFLFRQGGDVAALEQAYAKQIALIIDSAKPGMKITLDMEDAFESGEWFKENYPSAVKITDNIVTVKLSEESSYSYSFFNDVSASVDVYPEGGLLIIVNG